DRLQPARFQAYPVSAFRTQSEPCPEPANADHAHLRKNRAALARAPSADAPCRVKLQLAAACFFGREIQTPRSPRWRREEKSRKIHATYLILVDNGDVLPASLLQQLVHADLGESRITRFDRQKKSVVRYPAEAVPVEQGMVPARQAVHPLPRKKCGECAEEHGQLKHDWEKRGHGPKIPSVAMHIERVETP